MTARTRFARGQLVAHRRYGYRGAIAACDPRCRASEAWYRSNRTQPAREQPWYHVLVHGSGETTYVAEENLVPYEGGEQVSHPLVRTLFESFSRGRYRPRPDVQFPVLW